MFKLGLVIPVTFWKIIRYTCMRHLFILFVILFFASCQTEKTVQLANGEFVSERRYNKLIKKSYRSALRQMSKEDKKIIKSIRIDVDKND